MKRIDRFTLRGTFDRDDVPKRIGLFNGRYDIGYKIVEFHCALPNPVVNDEFRVVIGTEEDVDFTFDWNDNTQIAWAYGGNNASTSATFSNFSFVDPDNLTIEDLYITGNKTGSGEINYMIVVEKYELEPYQGSLAIVRNMAQG